MDQVSFCSNQFNSIASPQVNVVHADGGLHVWVLGILVTLKAMANETGGSYSLFEEFVPPGIGPPPHIHTQEDETWYVLDGELECRVGDKAFHATKGFFINLPRFVKHGFVNKSDKPARVMLTYAPAGLEQWYLDVGTPVADRDAPGEAPPVTNELVHMATKLSAEKYGVVFRNLLFSPDEEKAEGNNAHDEL